MKEYSSSELAVKTLYSLVVRYPTERSLNNELSKALCILSLNSFEFISKLGCGVGLVTASTFLPIKPPELQESSINTFVPGTLSKASLNSFTLIHNFTCFYLFSA